MINMWEFTITVESLYGFGDYFQHGNHSPFPPSHPYGNVGGYGGYGGYGGGVMGGGHLVNYHPNSNNNATTTNNNGVSTVIRAQIKKIARNCVGRNGRVGAVFERGGLESLSDDPLLREQSSDGGDEDSGGDCVVGKWRIPLGAYHPLMTYLTSPLTYADGRGSRNVVEGIPPEQLRMATLGRERMDKKVHATVDELLSRNVAPGVARALAPYQRSGVEFVLDRDGRALLADEMGLGKTVQAIAAMSAYAGEDWPLLVLCPSTARYHWEVEFRHWMGAGSTAGGVGGDGGWEGEDDDGGGDREEGVNAAPSSEGDAATTPELPMASRDIKTTKDAPSTVLEKGQINVLTSGRDLLFKNDGSTRVVICSIGLIVNLVASDRIRPGMFRAIVVDESHALKNKDAKRTKVLLPLLRAARRCLLLSGTPAFAKPSELWRECIYPLWLGCKIRSTVSTFRSFLFARTAQLSVLGSREANGGSRRGNNDASSGIWCDEDEFMSKYVKGKGEEGSKARYDTMVSLFAEVWRENAVSRDQCLRFYRC